MHPLIKAKVNRWMTAVYRSGRWYTSVRPTAAAAERRTDALAAADNRLTRESGVAMARAERRSVEERIRLLHVPTRAGRCGTGPARGCRAARPPGSSRCTALPRPAVVGSPAARRLLPRLRPLFAQAPPPPPRLVVVVVVVAPAPGPPQSCCPFPARLNGTGPVLSTHARDEAYVRSGNFAPAPRRRRPRCGWRARSQS